MSDSVGRRGWGSRLARACMGFLAFEAVSGLAIPFLPFGAAIQWSVLLHTAIGALTLLPIAWYLASHWLDTRHYRFNADALLGYAASVALAVCVVSGLVVTWQGLLGTRTSAGWRQVHLISTFALLALVLPHLLVLVPRLRRAGQGRAAAGYAAWTLVLTAAGVALVVVLPRLYAGIEYVNEFPADYARPFGDDRPFAPSLARTDTGGAFDARSLSGSATCGTSGCHEQIVAEWGASAHRYSAKDVLFQGIQEVMAKQNGAESTRYCGGCHDPISLFSGTKNLFVEDLTALQGFNEGVSCLACHAIRETDIQGNANYVITQPREYLWQWADAGPRRLVRDFLIRAYPAEHQRLSKRMFKAPQYCAACHKQFIDKEVNQVGWVQLQNQYDNWAASHWNVEGDPERTIECRECHMPLVDSSDPAAGDVADYNRSADDRKHRSHRFLASNMLMPEMLKLPGWQEQVRLTDRWLKGEYEIPEIRDKWADGPVIQLALDVPEKVSRGGTLPVRVVFTSNKVGHDFPTGPLDIIQSWLELEVTDAAGNVIFQSGQRNEENFIEPGTFMFKAEPVDQYGNLIDRHNLWEMVGVRYRRALFPGYSDTVEFRVDCSAALQQAPGVKSQDVRLELPEGPGTYEVSAVLRYRKVDQFLLNFLLGEGSGVTAPVSEIARAHAVVEVTPS